MKRGIFITGTDTGVGKTFIGAGIARALRRQGIDVGVMKPAETGCLVRRGSLVPQDATALKEAAHVDDGLDLVNPYRFRAPLAPAVAAEQEGVSIDMRRITASFHALERRHGFMIVEGAGGIMVPLSKRHSFLDLAAILKLPVLIVARPGLGTINHTLLTVTAIKQRKIPIAGIVVNYCRNSRSGLAERTSPSEIEKRSRVPILGIVQYEQNGLTNSAINQLMKHICSS